MACFVNVEAMRIAGNPGKGPRREPQPADWAPLGQHNELPGSDGHRPRGGHQGRAPSEPTAKIWSLMQLERQLRPQASSRRRAQRRQRLY